MLVDIYRWRTYKSSLIRLLTSPDWIDHPPADIDYRESISAFSTVMSLATIASLHCRIDAFSQGLYATMQH